MSSAAVMFGTLMVKYIFGMIKHKLFYNEWKWF